jgi:hypothetical protein
MYLGQLTGISVIRISARLLKACDQQGRIQWQVQRLKDDPVTGGYMALVALMRARRTPQ